MTSYTSRTVIFCIACFCSTTLLATAQEQILVSETRQVRMPDGVRLSTEVYMPGGPGPFPAVVMRTPYTTVFGNEWAAPFFEQFLNAGYVVVVQDCRGTGDSGGDWLPFSNEHSDGQHSLNWVLQQPWCNKKLATFGGSYTGFTQWAAAPAMGEKLTAMISLVPAMNWYDVCYQGGAYRLEMTRVWNTIMDRPKSGQVSHVAVGPQRTFMFKNAAWKDVFWHMPLRNWGGTYNTKISWDQSGIDHPTPDSYWRPSTTTVRTKELATPNLTITGWYDQFLNHTLEYSPRVKKLAATDSAKRHQHLVIGPWGHYLTSVGQLDFGDQATVDFGKLYGAWLQYWLERESSGVAKWPYVRVFVMGANVWRDEHEWPLDRTEFTNFYFHSKGNANEVDGDGYLDTAKPGAEVADEYIYDPNEPVPTHGGPTSFLTSAGPMDQREIERREDVLVYTSAVLEEPVEVTGPVRVVLYASSSCRDTDWVAKLVDVHPNGEAYNLCEGIIRARYRESRLKPKLLNPNATYRYEIDLWGTSNLFRAGHRIRVDISSSNFPRFDRNPNTGKAFGLDDGLKEAKQTVYHDRMRPSHVVLPVIPQ